jgi:GalNAc-alpha-(1->4)-GalNAc-alpha-(1->3)-diNAcBac-PP-undecaprenol alpha-1,4-N-acetyl-D-galactosaminyltransferase
MPTDLKIGIIGGIKELIKDKWNGLLFKHGDNKDLSKKINYLLNNRHLIEKYSQNALEITNNNFNSNLYYKKLTKLYHTCINDLKTSRAYKTVGYYRGWT